VLYDDQRTLESGGATQYVRVAPLLSEENIQGNNTMSNVLKLLKILLALLAKPGTKGSKMFRDVIKVITVIAALLGVVYASVEFLNSYLPPACCAVIEHEMIDNFCTKDSVNQNLELIQSDILRIEGKLDIQNQNVIGIYQHLIKPK